jgi:hypothetical protein
MNSLYHRGIITPFPADQVESYMTLYGFRVTEQHDDLFTLIRDPVPMILSELSTPSDGLTWNLDHYPLTQEGTRQLECDLKQWGVSDHDRMVLLLTHQERYGAVVAHLWMGTQASPYPYGDTSFPHTPLPWRLDRVMTSPREKGCG